MNASQTALHQFVTFRLDHEFFGLAIHVVKEVNPTTAVSPVPLSKQCIRGVVNIRGQVVLVIDIAVIFGHPPRPIGTDSQLVILKTSSELTLLQSVDIGSDKAKFSEKAIAFLVDSIEEVVTVNQSVIEAPPPHLSSGNAAYVQGVVRTGNDLLILLDAAMLLTAS